jgi:hypothetical protein
LGVTLGIVEMAEPPLQFLLVLILYAKSKHGRYETGRFNERIAKCRLYNLFSQN